MLFGGYVGVSCCGLVRLAGFMKAAAVAVFCTRFPRRTLNIKPWNHLKPHPPTLENPSTLDVSKQGPMGFGLIAWGLGLRV